MFYSDTAYNAIKAGKVELARPPLEQAVPLSRELGDPWVLASVAGNVGLQALFSNDLDGAGIAFEEQLRLCGEHAWNNHVAAEGQAGIAAHQADPERAAGLLVRRPVLAPMATPTLCRTPSDVASGLRGLAYGEELGRGARGRRSYEARMSLERAIAKALGLTVTNT